MNALKTLVIMQLKDKLDFSFTGSKRNLILKIVLSVVKLAAVCAVFFVLFLLSVKFSIFSLSPSALPDTVINIVFTVIQILAIISCTIGLSNALYLSADNKVLLTLPVSSSQIFVSKLILFYIFEVKRNIFFTLPMFIAYGIVNSAVWYYYIWLIPVFLLISFIPVAVGSILSIPAMFVEGIVRKFKWLQFSLMIIASALIVWGIVAAINNIPQNINILSQWGKISEQIALFLHNFSRALIPFYWMCLLAIGGTYRIGAKLIGLDTLAYLGGTIGVAAVLFGLAFLLARPLFFKMASRQFEYEKKSSASHKNVVHSAKSAPYFESIKMSFRSNRRLLLVIVEFALPAILTLFLNRLYSAMNTSFLGQTLTQTFNVLVMFVVMLSFNSVYASVYSRESNARNIMKTRPNNPLRTLFARISFRAVTIILSSVAVITVYCVVGGVAFGKTVMLGIALICASLAHLLWCAEIDVMHSQTDQYQTIGVDFDNPNERNATIIGLLIAVLFTVLFNMFNDRGETAAFVKIMLIAIAFFAARVYLYVTRVKLYFIER